MPDIKNTIKHGIDYMKKPKEAYLPIVEVKRDGDLLAGKHALVTGGSGGIGFAIARKLVACGAKVIIAGTNEEKLRCKASELGHGSEWLRIDMLDPASFKDKVDQARSMLEGLDILVCSAGIHMNYQGLDFLNVDESQYDRIMAINLKGTYFMAQAFARCLIAHGDGGHILMVSSQSALEPAWSPYRLSKHGVSEITKGIAQRLLEHGIVVNGIGPGPTATSMQPYMPGGSINTDQNPIGRYTMPEEVAEYAALMVSSLGDTIVGDTLYMSGGRGVIEIR